MGTLICFWRADVLDRDLVRTISMRQVHLKTLWSIYSEDHRTSVLTGNVSLDAFSEKAKVHDFGSNGLTIRADRKPNVRGISQQVLITIEAWLGHVHLRHGNVRSLQLNWV